MKPHPAIRVVLLPASWVFQVIVRLRAWLYRAGIFKQNRLHGIVISVGNLTVGGTGKTPFVLYLAEELGQQGRRVGVLTRGYRGAGGDSDEVSLLRNRLGEKAALGVGADRFAQGRRLIEKGIEAFILDDGFQHLRLARDVDIVLIDSTDPFGGGFLLPAGRLREPRSALGRAKIIVITRAERAPGVEAAVRRHTDAPIFYADTLLEEICPGEQSRVRADSCDLSSKKVFAFCAIGNAAAFFGDVEKCGLQLVGRAEFPDHFRYTLREVAEIERQALACGAEALLATEKDLYNLGKLMFRSLPLFYCRIKVGLTEPQKFWQVFDTVLERKLAGTA